MATSLPTRCEVPRGMRSGHLSGFGSPGPHLLRLARAVLKALGGPGAVTDVSGRAEDASTIKLLRNMLWFGQVAATTEALLLAKALGIDAAGARDLLPEGPGGSAYLTDHAESLIQGDYMTGFSLDRVFAELEIIGGLARDARIPFRSSALVTDLHRRAGERFGPSAGELASARLLEDDAGLTLADS